MFPALERQWQEGLCELLEAASSVQRVPPTQGYITRLCQKKKKRKKGQRSASQCEWRDGQDWLNLQAQKGSWPRPSIGWDFILSHRKPPGDFTRRVTQSLRLHVGDRPRPLSHRKEVEDDRGQSAERGLDLRCLCGWAGLKHGGGPGPWEDGRVGPRCLY